jgi:beta-lysine 5,6-aminomutase beta subunit
MSQNTAQVNLKKLKPYGDIMNDGTVQLCFTLPVEPSPEAREAAIQLCEKMGYDQIKVATMEKAANGFSLFVIYGNLKHTVDFTQIHVVKVDAQKRSREEIDEIIKTKIGRKLVVIGACTGFDAHTVGIDAIMNMKGFAGDYGLERYQWLDARNLGAQVLNDELLKRAVAENADAVLVSKVVTQHNIHMRDMKDLMNRARQMGLGERMIFVSGGPRVTHPLALECGFDAGFGVGTKPSDVASYIVEEFLRRRDVALSGEEEQPKPATAPTAPVVAKAAKAAKSKTRKAASRLAAKSQIAKRPKTRASSKR